MLRKASIDHSLLERDCSFVSHRNAVGRRLFIRLTSECCRKEIVHSSHVGALSEGDCSFVSHRNAVGRRLFIRLTSERCRKEIVHSSHIGAPSEGICSLDIVLLSERVGEFCSRVKLGMSWTRFSVYNYHWPHNGALHHRQRADFAKGLKVQMCFGSWKIYSFAFRVKNMVSEMIHITKRFSMIICTFTFKCLG